MFGVSNFAQSTVKVYNSLYSHILGKKFPIPQKKIVGKVVFLLLVMRRNLAECNQRRRFQN